MELGTEETLLMNSPACVDFAVRGCLLIVSIGLALCLALLLPDGKAFADQGFLWYVNAGQHNLLAERIAYAAFCLLIGLSAFSFSLLNARRHFLAQATQKAALLYLIISLAVGSFGLASICYYSRDLAVASATAFACIASVFIARRVPIRVIDPLALVLAACAFLVAVVPGIISTPDLSSHFPEALADIETHQALSTAQAFQLAEGGRLFEEVGARYGVLWQSLLGAWAKLVHPLSVGDTVMFTRVLHTIFFALVAIAYFKFSRRTFVAALLAVLFIAPWMELKQQLFVFPQVTAWRYMGFAVAPLAVLVLERARWRTRCLFLGTTAGLALLSDFASGASVTAGLFVYLIFCKDNVSLLRTIGFFLSGLLAAFLVFFAGFACLFGYIPSPSSFFFELKNTIWEAAGGTAPVVSYCFDPLAILILVHTAYAGMKLAGKGPHSLCSRDALRLFVAVASLLWFVHYVNEPNTFALRACRVLYGFFLVDFLRTLITCKRRNREASEPLWILNLILVTVIIPATIVSYQPGVGTLVAKLSKKERQSTAKTLVSGVYLSEDIGNALLRKSQFIKESAGDGPVFYITADSSFVPSLSGKVSATPLADPFAQIIFSRQSEKFIKQITDKGAKTVYVDDPDFITSKGVCRRAFFDYLRVMLARNYRLSGSQHGWQTWVLKDSESGAASGSSSGLNSGSRSDLNSDLNSDSSTDPNPDPSTDPNSLSTSPAQE